VSTLRSRGEGSMGATGIVKLSEIDQKLGYTRIHHSLIIQHSGCWSEGKISPL
jgi:hypothetical protein